MIAGAIADAQVVHGAGGEQHYYRQPRGVAEQPWWIGG
jgi:hypothetical protein